MKSLLAALAILAVDAKCVDIKNTVDVGKKITDFTTYYTTQSIGDIVMQVKTAPDGAWYLPLLQVIPESGDVSAYDSTYIDVGRSTTLAYKVKANFKFRLQFQMSMASTGVVSPIDTLEGTLCYPTEGTPTTATETSVDYTTTATKATAPTTAPSDSSSTESKSSKTGTVLGIVGGIVAAILGAGGLTYLCRNVNLKCFSKDITHIHNTSGNLDDNTTNDNYIADKA